MIKSKKHKLLFALVLLAMAIMLAGCNKEEKKNKNENEKATEDVSNEQNENDANIGQGDNQGDDDGDKFEAYITVDGSVKLGNYKGIEYVPADTIVSEEELNECMKETLEYFQEFMEIDELTDEIVAEFYEGFETVDELKEGFRVILADEKLSIAEYNNNEQVVGKLVETSEIYVDLTDDAIAAYNSLIKHYNVEAVKAGMELSEYMQSELSLGVDEWELYVAEEASSIVVKRRVLLAVAEAEKLTVSETEYDERIAAYMEYYGYEDSAIFEYEFSVDAIKKYMLEDIAMEFLLSQAIPVEETDNN